MHTQHLLGVVEDFEGHPALVPATLIGHTENHGWVCCPVCIVSTGRHGGGLFTYLLASFAQVAMQLGWVAMCRRTAAMLLGSLCAGGQLGCLSHLSVEEACGPVLAVLP